VKEVIHIMNHSQNQLFIFSKSDYPILKEKLETWAELEWCKKFSSALTSFFFALKARLQVPVHYTSLSFFGLS